MKNRDEARPRRRRVGLLARAAFAAVSALAIATPAQAATIAAQINIDDVYATASQGAYAELTYSCTATSGVTSIDMLYINSLYGIYTPGATPTCDGTSHKKTVYVGGGTAGYQATLDACLVDANGKVVDGASESWSGTLSKPPAAVIQASQASIRPASSVPIFPCSS